MGMNDLVEALVRQSEGLFWAFLYADGLLTNIRITYHPRGQMEIHDLPWEGFDYILLSGEVDAFRDREQRERLPDDVAKAFQLCRLWDPRIVSEIVKEEEEVSPGRWRARYDIRGLSWRLHEEQVKWFQAQPDNAFVRPVEFVEDDGILSEMTEEDFSGAIGTRIMLQFAYQGYRPRHVKPLTI